MQSGGYCDGDTVVDCFLGFATGREDCGESDRVCVSNADWPARCSISAERDARCGLLSGMNGTLCDGASVAHCAYGYLVELEPCPLACAAVSPREAFCASSSDPEPICQAPDQLRNHADMCIADGLSAYCDRGYLRQRSTCTLPASYCMTTAYERYCPRSEHDLDAGAE
jgi:hypothetical protein